MTPTEKLLRDIETLRASVRTDWADLGTKSLSKEERAGIRQHIEICNAELKGLLEKLWKLED
jgi:hypothetical protein